VKRRMILPAAKLMRGGGGGTELQHKKTLRGKAGFFFDRAT